MKLILVTAINQFKAQIQKMFKNSGIQNYSYQEVVGHRDISSVADKGNWFVGDRFESQSILFFAFVPQQKVDGLFEEVKQFNSNLESLSRIHISVMNIERTN